MGIMFLIFACIFFVVLVNALRSGNRPIRKHNPNHNHTNMWPGDSQTRFDSAKNDPVPTHEHGHHEHHHGDGSGGHHGGHDGGGHGGGDGGGW